MRHKDEHKKLAISKAAIQLINRIGFAEVSMSKIANDAGVSPATIYTYFENKEELLNQLYLKLKWESSKAFLKDFDPTRPAEENLKDVWRNMRLHYLSKPDDFSFVEQFSSSPLVNCEKLKETYQYFQPLIDLYRNAVKHGQIKNIPLEFVEAFSFFPLMQLIKQHLNGQLDVSDEMYETAMDIAWDAITA